MENGFLNRFFKLSERGTTARTEILAGVTTFMTISYILTVNPNILGDAGMDVGAAFTATAIVSIIGTLLMAFLANLPFVLTAGMGLNAYFAYTVVLGMGYDWTFALTAVFIVGIIFLLISSFKFRETIFNAIPDNLKKAISVGIGLFITLVGFVNSGLVTAGSGTVLQIGTVTSGPVLVTLFGVILTGVLLYKNVPGSILLGIVGSTILAVIIGVAQLPTSIISMPPSIEPGLFKLDFSNVFHPDMVTVVIAMLMINMFDAIGAIVGVASSAGLVDDKGNVENAGPALQSVALGTTAASLLGASPVTVAVESASGVGQGGRTGLTGVMAAILFAASLFFYPLIAIIPSSATAPALIIVGLMMLGAIKGIDLNDFTEAIPAFLTITAMPFAYSTADGIKLGIVSYVFIKVFTGKARDVSWLMYLFAAIFILMEIMVLL